ncbi:FAD-binding protein [Campylobacter hyointestinalis]|uniref:FAD-binding protein n=1 Tax=Campylobacter hyointestinalis TaxID=198 RepID=UPI0021589AEC|nr:FAD-binding protein [Campylobacter hyointestinalis]
MVVGSGFAGTAAACQAIDEGAKTLLIDKMPVLGGNSAINGGAFAVVNSSFQKVRGIEDSYELYVKDILKAGLGLNRMDLVEVIAKNGNDAYEYTLKKRRVLQRRARSVRLTFCSKNDLARNKLGR